MKKYIFFTIIFIAVCFSSCKNIKSDEAVTDAFNQENFIEEIRENVLCLKSCAEETFGAEADFSQAYMRIYESEAAYNKSDKPVKMVLSSKISGNKVLEEENLPANYYIDPAYADLYLINNFNTNEQVKEYLRKYMSEDLIQKWFKEDFFEYEDKLYMIRGGRGYGAVSCDEQEISFVKEENGVYYISVNWYLFDEFYYKELLGFENINGSWVLTKEISE